MSYVYLLTFIFRLWHPSKKQQIKDQDQDRDRLSLYADEPSCDEALLPIGSQESSPAHTKLTANHNVASPVYLPSSRTDRRAANNKSRSAHVRDDVTTFVTFKPVTSESRATVIGCSRAVDDVIRADEVDLIKYSQSPLHGNLDAIEAEERGNCIGGAS